MTQFQSAGAEYWRSEIGQALVKYTGCSQVYDRSDAATRAREGLPERKEVLEGEEPPQEVEIVEDGIKYGVDVRMGHKTGFTLTSATTALWPADLPKNSRKFTAEA